MLKAGLRIVVAGRWWYRVGLGTQLARLRNQRHQEIHGVSGYEVIGFGVENHDCARIHDLILIEKLRMCNIA